MLHIQRAAVKLAELAAGLLDLVQKWDKMKKIRELGVGRYDVEGGDSAK